MPGRIADRIVGGAAPEFDVIILADDRGSRPDGVSKTNLVIGGKRLLDVVLGTVRHARTTVAVGPVAVSDGVLVTIKDPSGTEPAARIVTGLDAVEEPAEWTVALICDLPSVQAAVPRLSAVTTRGDDLDGHYLASAEGTPQWPLEIHRTARSRVATRAYGDLRDRFVRRLLTGMRPGLLPDAGDDGRDMDTQADHAHWNEFWRDRMSQDKTS